MRLSSTTRRSTPAAALLCLALTPAVWAQGVGNSFQLPIIHHMNPAGGWQIGAAANPVPVVLNPAGPSWFKNLTGPGGQPIIATPGQTFTLDETLVIAGNLPWTDWHERIVPDGWDWTSNISILTGAGVPPAGLSIVTTPATPITGGIVDFFFNALAPGTVLNIHKELIYVGQPGATFQGNVLLQEHPTPEPASLVLIAAGAALALKRRRAAYSPLFAS